MAWGLWNKIKTGLKKAGKWIKTAAKTVTDKVIKPFKPIIGAAASVINPALGFAVNKGMDAIERFSDDGWGNTRPRDAVDVGGKAVTAATWAKNRFERKIV